MSESPFVSIDEIVAALNQSGVHASTRTVFNDIAAGRIPGEFRITGIKRQRRIPIVKRHEWNKYLAGEDWKQHRAPVGIHSVRNGKVA